MNTISIARRYRPQTLADLIGQDVVKETLTHAFNTGKTAQAYVFTGIRGTGKTSTGRILARNFNCENGPTATPCLTCAQCLAITKDAHPDYFEIDAATHSTVEDVRTMTANAYYRPMQGRMKIYTVDEAHSLSDKAWEAFLKAIEEPAPHVVWVFLTTEARKIPATILSRCQVFALRRIDSAAIAAHLAKIAKDEKIAFDDAALAQIARSSEGSMRDALTLFEQAIQHGQGEVRASDTARMLGMPGRISALKCLLAALNKNAAAASLAYRSCLEAGASPEGIARDLLEVAHLIAVGSVDQKLLVGFGVGGEEARLVAEGVKNFGAAGAQAAYTEFTKTILELKDAPSGVDLLEMSLFRLSWR